MGKTVTSPGVRARVSFGGSRSSGVLLFALFIGGLVCASVSAATLVWNPNPESNIGGYYVYVNSQDQNEFFRVDAQFATLLNLAFAKPGNRYTFFVTAYNRAGVESNPSESVTYDVPIPLGWPQLLAPLPDLAVHIGQAVSFFAPVTGASLRFQWFKDDVELPGQTNISLLFFAKETDTGRYNVRVSNHLGSVDSRKARLDILTPPKILSQDHQIHTMEGMSAELSGVVSGTQPFTFRWFRNGTRLKEFTEASIFLPATSPADSGLYMFEVQNQLGLVRSDPIYLIVEPFGEPAQLSIVEVAEGLALRVSGTPGASYLIEKSHDMNEASWTQIGSVVLKPDGAELFEISSGDAALFLRASPLYPPPGLDSEEVLDNLN